MTDPTVPTAVGADPVVCTRVDDAAWKPLSTVYCAVADLDGAVARLERAGVPMTSPPAPVHTHGDGTEEWMAFLTDPAGNTLGLMATRQKN